MRRRGVLLASLCSADGIGDLHAFDDIAEHGVFAIPSRLVDQVDEIVEIANENIQPAPEFGADIRVEFIQAMGRIDEKFIILLEISRVLSVTELSQLNRSINVDSVLVHETNDK